MLHTVTIQQNDSGQRVDKFLLKFMPNMPKNMLYKLIRKKDIRLNSARCQGTEFLKEGDVLTIYAKEEFFKVQPHSNMHFMQASGKLKILHEDKHFLIVYKPSGVVAHSQEKGIISLLDEVQKYLYQKGEYRPQEEQTFAPALCNRIDRNTEGILIAAKNAAALRMMNELIRERQIQKNYIAITSSHLPEHSATCTAFLKKDEKQNQVFVSDKPLDKNWKLIQTRYEVLEQNGNLQLVRITLLTGRTHQIRAHLAHLGAPLLGDPKYNTTKSHEENQCLCAWELQFPESENPILSALSGNTIRTDLPDFVERYFPNFTV